MMSRRLNTISVASRTTPGVDEQREAALDVGEVDLVGGDDSLALVENQTRGDNSSLTAADDRAPSQRHSGTR